MKYHGDYLENIHVCHTQLHDKVADDISETFVNYIKLFRYSFTSSIACCIITKITSPSIPNTIVIWSAIFFANKGLTAATIVKSGHLSIAHASIHTNSSSVR